MVNWNLIIIILLVLNLASSVVLWIFYYMLRKKFNNIHYRVRDLHMDTKISNVFSGSDEDKSIHDLANDLFKEAKTRYNLKAHSYSDMIKELSQIDNIEDDMRDALIDFFEHMIVISYKEEGGPHFEHEMAYLKKKLKVIVHRMMDKK